MLVFLFLVGKPLSCDMQVFVHVLDGKLREMTFELPEARFSGIDGFENLVKDVFLFLDELLFGIKKLLYIFN